MTNHAAAVLAAALALAPLAARAESAKSDLVDAKNVLEQAVQQHPNNAELRVHLGFAYKKLGDADNAQKQFEAAAKDDPSNAEVFYMLGLIYEKKGQKEEAASAWKSCAAAAKEPGMKQTAQKHLHLLEATKH